MLTPTTSRLSFFTKLAMSALGLLCPRGISTIAGVVSRQSMKSIQDWTSVLSPCLRLRSETMSGGGGRGRSAIPLPSPSPLTFSADRLDCLLHYSVIKVFSNETTYLGSSLDSNTEDLRGLPETLRDLDLARGMKTGSFFLSLVEIETTGLAGLLPEI